MSFSQANITGAHAQQTGADLLVSWTSTAAAGTVYQVYIDNRLAWHGTALRAVVPSPPTGFTAKIDVGYVDSPANGMVDYSSSLPAPAWDDQALLSWIGGAFESATLAGFYVYQATAPGGAVNYATAVGTIAAYPQGAVIDGFGIGGFGGPVFGSAAGTYTWESPPLATGGNWTFGVKAFDSAGNLSTTVETTVAITAPPPPPATVNGRSIWIQSYNATTHVAVVEWNASP